jgi:hypothetical protein
MQVEKRTGEDRRESQVTHGILFDKLLEHERKIMQNSNRLINIEKDVKIVKDQMLPINDGIRSMVFLFKIAIAIGAISAAGLGFIEFYEHSIIGGIHVVPEE